MSEIGEGRQWSPLTFRDKTDEGAPAQRKGRILLLESVQRVTLFHLLLLLDQDLARACQDAGCPHCGARLDRAPYRRKPRGGPGAIPEESEVRLSLCCSQEGCRRRRLPPSCLYWGRKVYWGPVILVVVTLRQQRLDGFSARRVREQFGITRSTLARWMAYFREVFPSSPWWQRLRGRASASVRNAALPAVLVESFVSSTREVEAGLGRCLLFLAGGQADPPCSPRFVMERIVHAKDGQVP